MDMLFVAVLAVLRVIRDNSFYTAAGGDKGRDCKLRL